MSATAREIRQQPLNKDFVWSMTRPERLRALTEAEFTQFDEQGFVRLDGVFTPQEIAEVTATIDPLEAKGEEHLRSMGGRLSISEADVITFTIHMVTKSEVLKRFAAHPKIQDICADLIGGDDRLHSGQPVYRKTGKRQEFP